MDKPLRRWAALVGGVAGGGLMFAADKLNWNWPPTAVWIVAALSIIGLPVSAVLWAIHIGLWLRTKGFRMGPTLVMAVGAMIFLAGLGWGLWTWKPARTGASAAPPAKSHPPSTAQSGSPVTSAPPTRVDQVSSPRPLAGPVGKHEKVGPLEWDFSGYNSPVGWSRSSGAPLWADAFFIQGRNPGGAPIDLDSAYVRSEITNNQIDLIFADSGNDVALTERSIMPKAAFGLIGRIKSIDPTKSQGIVADQFRQKFGRFSFIFRVGGKTYERHVSSDEVDAIIDLNERLTRQALPIPKPGLAPRSASPPSEGR